MTARTAATRTAARFPQRRDGLSRRALSPVLVAAAALPLLAACGSSSPAPSANETTSAPSTTAAAPAATVAPATQASSSTPSTPASTPASSSASASASGPTCDLDKLRVSAGDTNGAAGHEMDVFLVTNAGTTTCTVEGYPAVALRTSSGAKAAVTVTHDGDYTFPALAPKAVALAPGGVASFAIGFTRAPQDDSEQCPSGQRLDVVLPGATTVTKLPVDVTACNKGSLAVSPVVTGANGPS